MPLRKLSRRIRRPRLLVVIGLVAPAALLWRMLTTTTTKAQEPCQLDPEGPLPVILMARGRSGSSVTWETLSALTGHRNHAHELTGSNPNSTAAFFQQLVEDGAPSDWTLDELCDVQRRAPSGSGIAGFQWKPFSVGWDYESALRGLQAIGREKSLNSVGVVVRVVYLQRNPLDVLISNTRHDMSVAAASTLEAHCHVGDVKCLEAFLKVKLPTILEGDELIQFLRWSDKSHQRSLDLLRKYDVTHINVHYEDLYDNDNDASEWMKLFNFLGKGPAQGLTMDTVRANFALARTHSKQRSLNQTIANYQAVYDTLDGTEYKDLLFD